MTGLTYELGFKKMNGDFFWISIGKVIGKVDSEQRSIFPLVQSARSGRTTKKHSYFQTRKSLPQSEEAMHLMNHVMNYVHDLRSWPTFMTYVSPSAYPSPRSWNRIASVPWSLLWRSLTRSSSVWVQKNRNKEKKEGPWPHPPVSECSQARTTTHVPRTLCMQQYYYHSTL